MGMPKDIYKGKGICKVMLQGFRVQGLALG